MKTTITPLFIFLLAVISITKVIAQTTNHLCEDAFPFCTNTQYSFPAGVGNGNAQVGPYYGCLTTTPNPAWYYMKIALPGTLIISMYSQPAYDIDYICWGPFDTKDACGQLTANKVVSCSYSPAPTEVCTINNAPAGKFYILLITNFSNQPCNIIFSQTGGMGKTDCSILPPPASNNGPLCIGETLHLTAANMNNAQYHWTAPDGWSSNLQNPSRLNVQPSMAGQYALFVTISGQPSDTSFTEVLISPPPTASISGDTAICAYSPATLHFTCTGSPPWTIIYKENAFTPHTVVIPESPFSINVSPLTTTTYTISSVTNAVCSGTGTGIAVVTVMPKPVGDFTFMDNCSGHATSFFDQTTVTSGSVSTWLWDFGFAGANSNMQNPVYTYPSGGSYNVSLRVQTNNGCLDTVVKPLQIHPTPVASAGNDFSIPYGTTTSLNGLASGGSGSYSYQWEPASLLVNAAVANPNTLNLTETTDFTLSVTDQNNLCVSVDVVTVTITGGPLAINIVPAPESICLGGSTYLNAMAGGGSGNYTYSWSSNPAGFTSNLEDVTVEPTVTTVYTLLVNDGFNTSMKSITIIVWPQPQSNAGADNSIFHGGVVQLNGSVSSGTSPFTYHWQPENMVVSPISAATATHNLTSSANFTLHITDAKGCVSSDDVLVTISGVALNVNPFALVSPVCPGDSTKLFPMTEGGSGNYSYHWTSNPAGFSSNLSNPIVNPFQTTTYKVEVTDGFNTKQDSVPVIVNPKPVINLIPPGAHVGGIDTIIACVFDTLTLSSRNLDAVYIWSNGATADSIVCSTSGIAYDMQSYWLRVTYSQTGCSATDSLTILFTYAQCSYGIGEDESGMNIYAYPNPSNDKVYISCTGNPDEKILMQFFNSGGQLLEQKISENKSGGKIIGVFDIEAYPSGIYILQLSSGQLLEIFKVVKP